MTVVGIHQPNFIPSIGYFIKMSLSDFFVLYDTAQYTKNSFINRNRLSCPNQLKWITIPVFYKGKSRSPIHHIEIDLLHYKPNKIIQTINQCTIHTEFNKELLDHLAEHLREAMNHRRLTILNEQLLRWIASLLEIHTPILKSSDLNIPAQTGTEALIGICRALNGQIYISGKSGKNYLEEELFQKAGMELRYPDYYEDIDQWQGVSILQLLMSMGLEKVKLLIQTIGSAQSAIENGHCR